METALSKLSSLESADRYRDAVVMVIVQIILIEILNHYMQIVRGEESHILLREQKEKILHNIKP